MLFEKPSLRTRVAGGGHDAAGGHGIAYMTTRRSGRRRATRTRAQCCRHVHAVTARVNSREQIAGLAANSTIPIVNALDDYAHPMQMLADLQVMSEHLGVGPSSTMDGLAGVKLAFVGDIQNNVTYDLMRAGCLMGMEVSVSGPTGADYRALSARVRGPLEDSGGGDGSVVAAEEAVRGADFVYADSWMSYGVSGEARDARFTLLLQVNEALMKLAKPSAKFMNCLPAMRGEEQTAEMIVGRSPSCSTRPRTGSTPEDPPRQARREREREKRRERERERERERGRLMFRRPVARAQRTAPLCVNSRGTDAWQACAPLGARNNTQEEPDKIL